MNCNQNEEIINSIKSSKKLFVIIDHKDSEHIKNSITNRLNQLNLTDIQVNIISPKYENLTTIFNEYQEEEANFNPSKLAETITSKL